MGDAQDSTELLLQKARERRTRNAEAAFLKRERTGPEKMCASQNIASGISSSPTLTRKAYTASPIRATPTKGVASGVKGAKANPVLEIKAVPLTEIEDDFETLQENMRNRFKSNNKDTKENLQGLKRTFFDDPSSKNPLSPSKRNNTASPAKQYFPELTADISDDPVPPVRTASKLGGATNKYSDKASLSPIKNTSSTTSPSKATSDNASVSFSEARASFRSPAKKDSLNPRKNSALSPRPGLKTVPSLSIKPNSIVSRALAKLENKNLDDSEIIEPSEVETENLGVVKERTPVKLNTTSKERTPVKLNTTSKERTPVKLNTTSKERTPVKLNIADDGSLVTGGEAKERTPIRSNTTVDDSLFINTNMAQVESDLSDMRGDIKSDIIEEETEEIESQLDDSLEDLCDEVMPEESLEESLEQPAEESVEDLIEERGDVMVVRKTEVDAKKDPYKIETTDAMTVNEGMEGASDSIDSLCDDVMPSPSQESLDGTEDSEWLDFSPDNHTSASLKRDAGCLADSVFSSVESFISCDLAPAATKVTKDDVRKVMSPTHQITPRIKKLRRSASVSDIPKSPSRFVRLDALRSSSTSLKMSGNKYSDDSSSMSSQESQRSVRKNNTHRGPLEEGTLEIRPPFDQIKVLEQGIMVQNEVEAQSAQLLDHCQYGLEQVEAEKLHLIAGLKKEQWKHHLSVLKDDSYVFSSSELPKGRLEIKDISLLLRQDYLVNQVSDNKVNQASFLAVKVSPYRLITSNVATSQCNINGTNLTISDTITIENLPPDYRVTLEIYCMSYNMLNNATPAKKKKLEPGNKATPKRLIQSAMNKIGNQKNKSEKVFSSSMEMYGKGSPSHKGKIPTTASSDGHKFVLAGSVNLTIKDAKKSQFRMRRAPFHSPFEGTINLTMSAKEAITSQSPTHKGFLTIFQEESGLGAWNRRWCSVQDNKIYYWLYPEDEVNQNKEPHGEIELRKCKNEHVSVASRLDCARPNTFVLVLLTAAQPGDRSSIITESNGKTTQTKYMLAADSKEERKQWMEVLNKCLQSIHSWNH